MCTERHDDYNDATQNCRMSGSVKLFTNIETARPQYAVDDAFIKTQELQTFNKPFAQIDFEHQQLRNINAPETSICEHVIGILHTPLPGVEFWKTKTRINCKQHRKTEHDNNKICRVITL